MNNPNHATALGNQIAMLILASLPEHKRAELAKRIADRTQKQTNAGAAA